MMCWSLWILVSMHKSPKLFFRSFPKRNIFKDIFQRFPLDTLDTCPRNDRNHAVSSSANGLFGIKNLFTPQDFQNQSLRSLQTCQRLQQKV